MIFSTFQSQIQFSFRWNEAFLGPLWFLNNIFKLITPPSPNLITLLRNNLDNDIT